MLPTLLAQRYEDFEVIVIDDGSSDDTLEYLRQHWPQVRVEPNGENLGVAVSLNRAVQAAHGEYVALLNNDLELEPNWMSGAGASTRGASRGGKRRPGSSSTTTVAIGWRPPGISCAGPG